MSAYDSLQIREIFHLEFLRYLGKKVKTQNYALKGGVNLRFFFNSFRYSEDMDLDVRGEHVNALRDIVMKILQAPSLLDALESFGIEKIVPPDMVKAKQTETTQRFKIHLITASSEDLFTKIEFSRRGFKGKVAVQPVSEVVLRQYKMPPLLLPHYEISSAIAQKIEALANRKEIQARDIFDIYVLSSQYKEEEIPRLEKNIFPKARQNVFAVEFEQFRDTVLSYLSASDQAVYNTASSWDEIKLKVVSSIEELRKKNA